MQWKIRQYLFDEDKQCLSLENDVIQLEPRQSEVLAYFCAHPNELVSRDELVENVWQGQAVTDNAVNRIIAKLRKSLGDAAKQSEFIVTLPRKGYRFIAPVEAYSADHAPQIIDQPNNAQLSQNNLRKWAVPALLLLASIIGLSIWFIPSQSISYQFESVSALTRDSGAEYLPAISPDGKHLIYADYENQQLNLRLKNIDTGESKVISDQKGNAGNGDWSRDGTQFLYLYTAKPDICELRLLSFDPTQSMKVTNRQTVHQCPTGSYGNYALSHDSRKLIYSEIDDQKQTYHIYQKNLDSGKTTRIEQPPTYLAGNREFDLHPTENKLLIASPDEQQRLAFFVSDLDKGTLDFKFNMDGYICCPVWDHSGEKIIMTGPLPAFSIIEVNLDGSERKTIYTSAHRVYKLKRGPNSRSYVYSGGINNSEIQFLAYNDQSITNIISSTVADYRPSLSNNGRYLGFVSQRSGNSQIWVRDLSSGADRKLSNFEDNHQYFDLKWSPNDQKIAALTINGVRLIDFVSGQTFNLKIAQQEIRGISWLSDQNLSMTLLKEGKRLIYEYDLIKDALTPAKSQHSYQAFDFAQQSMLAVSEQNELYFNQQPLALTLEEIIDHNRHFYFEFKNGHLFWLRQVNLERDLGRLKQVDSEDRNEKSIYYQLVDYDLKRQKESIIATLEKQTQFTVGKNGVYFVELTGNSADIFKVVFKPD